MTEENQKPDYSFIMNQPGPELGTPKRSKKPFLLLGAVVLVLGVVTVVGLVVGRKATNVKQQVLSTGQQESAQFLEQLADGKTEESYNMYEQNNRPDKEYYTIFATQYPKRINMKTCTLRSDVSQVNADTSVFIYRCNYFSKPATSYIDFAFLYQNISSKKQLTKVQTAGINI